MVKEGRLEDLIAIEDQTEFIIKDANPELISNIKELVNNSAGASLIRTGKPRTTLERLFLRETTHRDEDL
jgi:ABC-2 type transport system ATP-binding protein